MQSQDRSVCLLPETCVRIFNVIRSVIIDRVHVHRVLDGVRSLEDARGVDTVAGNVAKSAESEFKFRTGADVQIRVRFAADVVTVQKDRHGHDSGAFRFDHVDVAEIVEMAVLLLVVDVDPAMESGKYSVVSLFAQVGVFPAATGYNIRNVFRPAGEPFVPQKLLELLNILGEKTCFGCNRLSKLKRM